MPSNNQFSKSDASRVQSTQAKAGNDMSAAGFAARAQSAGDRNANATSDAAGKSGGGGGGQGSGSSGNGGGGGAGGQGGKGEGK